MGYAPPINPGNAQGASGYSGYSGVGTSGFSGYSGATGSNGPTGASGFSGVSGFSGKSGYSGISGYSGVGTSGFSGKSGFSGYSGKTPTAPLFLQGGAGSQLTIQSYNLQSAPNIQFINSAGYNTASMDIYGTIQSLHGVGLFAGHAGNGQGWNVTVAGGNAYSGNYVGGDVNIYGGSSTGYGYGGSVKIASWSNGDTAHSYVTCKGGNAYGAGGYVFIKGTYTKIDSTLHVTGNFSAGQVRMGATTYMSSLPTSGAGLSSGRVYRSGNTLMVK